MLNFSATKIYVDRVQNRFLVIESDVPFPNFVNNLRAQDWHEASNARIIKGEGLSIPVEEGLLCDVCDFVQSGIGRPINWDDYTADYDEKGRYIQIFA